ncbi:excalibur calcium-binding domain-containing protein [Corynebacterium vitaeruminis]|uniref:excalibur calcium-binding domain-containing protein n=1 Tax=Corynebacterium vitaeruminis TaxID=38305 RepID=UPI001FD24B03|nr:excalibur calcium-binding domain-containing protein [Corynebacterium vitaeruminis]
MSSGQYKSPFFRQILAWIALVLGLLVMFAAGISLDSVLFGLALIVPAGWWFLHERAVRRNPTGPRLKRHWGMISAVAAALFVAGGAAAPDPEPTVEPASDTATVTSTSAAPTASKTASKTTSTASSTTTRATTSSAEPTPTIPATGEAVVADLPAADAHADVPAVTPAPVQQNFVAPVAPAAVPAQEAPAQSAYYANCAAARAAGAAPLYAGSPGYRAALDRDNDGVACE